MSKRQLRDFGLPPVWGFLLLIAGVVTVSLYIFHRTPYASYCLTAAAASLVFNYSPVKRNDFLKFVFPGTRYYSIRLLEHLIISSLFVIMLLVKKEGYAVTALLLVSVAAVFTHAPDSVGIRIPTPFYKNPFEFIVGFRKNILLIIVLYTIIGIAVGVQNVSLGMGAILLLILSSLSFYTDVEDPYFVWIYHKKPVGFLWYKIKIAIVYATLLSLPALLTLFFFFPAETRALVPIQLLGYAYLLLMISAKYAGYPDKMDLPRGIVIALNLSMPPLLLITIPIYYLRSLQRLQSILA